MKKIFLFLFVSLSFVFISCPHDCTPEEYRVFGKSIDNLPEWSKDVLASEWEPWNTEETAELKKLFKQKDSLYSNENINYRLFVSGQNIALFFDDEERSVCNPLWIWVSEYETGYNFISIPQEKEDEFVFTGHAKSNIFEKNTEENKAYVKIALLDEDASECNYILKVNNIEVINKNLTAYCNDGSVTIRYSDLVREFELNYKKEQELDPICFYFSAPINFSLIGDEDCRFDTGWFLYFNEGKSPMKKIKCDLDAKILIYELLGGTENMCHYVDIKYVSDDEITAYFYDLTAGEKKIRYIETLD